MHSLACAAPAIALFAPSCAAEIALTISNDLAFERRAEPVTCGVPLARGFASGPEELALFGPDGRAIPCQVLRTNAYADGAPRWVLLDFQADLPPAGRAVYRLARGRPADSPRRLAHRMLEGAAEIDTGAARIRVGLRPFRLLESVRIGGREILAGGGGPAIALEGGGRLGPAVVTAAEFEDAGPMRAVLAIRGRFGPQAAPPPAEFICRLHAFAGKSEIRLSFTLRNPAAHHHPGNVWDLGSGGSLFIEDLSLLLPLAGGPWASRIGLGSGPPLAGATKLYQDSSGGPRWNSANHVDKDGKVRTSFRGYRVYEGEAIRAEGERAEGWIHARSAAGGVAAAVRGFWQNFPKALELRAGALRIGLWPGEFAGAHEILGGEQKTHEILLVFHGADPEEEIARRLEAFAHPLYAMPDPEAIYATRAFWPTGPLDRAAHAALERTCDAFVGSAPGERSVIGRWEEIDEYGWRHFGDAFADNETAPEAMRRDHPEHFVDGQPISHFGNEYDLAYVVILQGLRRADPRWMALADALCRHSADIGIYHTDADGAAAYRHGPFTHTTHDTAAFRSTHRMYPSEGQRYGIRYASGGPNAGHCYVASLAQHYYLTGDRTSREAFLEVAGWSVESPWFVERSSHMGDPRGIGNLLMTHVYAFAMTGERRYADAALAMIDLAKEPFSGLGGTLFAKAAGRFLDLKIERGEIDEDFRKALRTLLAFGDLYLELPDDEPRRWLEQACFFAEVLFTCSIHAPADHPNRERYLARGKAIMDAARERWPGAYAPAKTLTMCFANTGAFFRAEALRRRGE